MITRESLKQFVESNPRLVTRKKQEDGTFVLKYQRRVFYDNLWNDFLEECRGLVIDEDYNIISFPFTKIYNFGVEDKAPHIADDEYVCAYRKYNGFMVGMTEYQGRLLVSTTGSTSSDFVSYAKSFVSPEQEIAIVEYCKETNMTLLFECCHPEDPHIIEEVSGLYLIGCRLKEYGSKVNHHSDAGALQYIATHLGVHLPYVWAYPRMEDVMQEVKTCKHEGYVIYTMDGRATKIKSPYYRTKKLFARASNLDVLLNGKAKTILDEEYYPLIQYVKDNKEHFSLLNEQERIKFVEEFLEK